MSNESLSLFFVAGKTPELVRSEFQHPVLAQTLIAERGRTSARGMFHWSPAVRALCVLVLRVRAWMSDPAERLHVEAPGLTGHKGSLAASLDYAFSKQPEWLIDMFGADARGESVTRRLFLRHNPERKRPGPVKIEIRPAALGTLRLRVLLDGAEVTDSDRLLSFAEAIERGDQTSEGIATQNGSVPQPAVPADEEPLPVPFDRSGWHEQASRSLCEVTLRALRGADVFSVSGLK